MRVLNSEETSRSVDFFINIINFSGPLCSACVCCVVAVVCVEGEHNSAYDSINQTWTRRRTKKISANASTCMRQLRKWVYLPLPLPLYNKYNNILNIYIYILSCVMRLRMIPNQTPFYNTCIRWTNTTYVYNIQSASFAKRTAGGAKLSTQTHRQHMQGLISLVGWPCGNLFLSLSCIL